MRYQTPQKPKKINQPNTQIANCSTGKFDDQQQYLTGKELQYKRTFVSDTQNEVNICLGKSLNSGPQIYPAYDKSFLFIFSNKNSYKSTIMHIDQNSKIKKKILTSSKSWCMISEKQIILLSQSRDPSKHLISEEEKFIILKTWNIKQDKYIIHKHKKFSNLASYKMIYFSNSKILCILESQIPKQSNTSFNKSILQTKITCYKVPFTTGFKPLLTTYLRHSVKNGGYCKTNQTSKLSIYQFNNKSKTLQLKILDILDRKIAIHKVKIQNYVQKELPSQFDWVQVTDIWQSTKNIIQVKVKAYAMKISIDSLEWPNIMKYLQKYDPNSVAFQFYIDCTVKKVYSYNQRQIPNHNELNQIDKQRKQLHILFNSNNKQKQLYKQPDYDPSRLLICKIQQNDRNLKCIIRQRQIYENKQSRKVPYQLVNVFSHKSV